MRIVRFDQNTDDWILWRSKGLGGSDAPIIAGVSEYSTPEKLLKDKLSHWNFSQRHTDKRKNGAQRRGHELEPIARAAYTAFTGIEVRPVCVIHQEIDWLRSSLDGLSLDDRIALEVKCIKKEYHEVALGGMVPGCYWPQVQHQLLTTGLPMMHYWSYSENEAFREGEKKVLVRVKAHKGYQEYLLKKETAFWEALMVNVEKLGLKKLTPKKK